MLFSAILGSALKILHVGEDISSRGFFFFFPGFFGGGFPPFFFFFWRARVEDYPPRGFIVGVTLSPPREPIFSRACMHRPELHLKKNCLRRHFHFLLLKKKGSLSDSVV